MKYILLIIPIYFPLLCSSQGKWDYNWVLGSFSDGIMIDFNEGYMEVNEIDRDMSMYATSNTISNESGNLLFYSNGCYIANANNTLMENGNNLNPGNIHSDFCFDIGYPLKQGAVTIPFPIGTADNIIIHTRFADAPFYSDKLYYTTIDMDLDGGLGAVVEKNVPVLEDSLWAGYLTATKHANNTDWWIIAGGYYRDQYYKLLLDSNGVRVYDYQDFDLGVTDGGWGIGQSAFSPDGTKYVHYDQYGPLLLFDFDRSTGQLGQPEQIFVEDTIFAGGAAISSNSRFLYISNNVKLFQFDLQADDIQGSKVLIGTYDGFVSPFATTFYLMQLAPDCRIYMNTTNGTDRLHVINSPNEKGTACDFQQHAVELPGTNFISIPNHPNYRLGTPYPVCDSSIQMVTASIRVLPPLQGVAVYPNPASGVLHIELPVPLRREGEWSLYSAVGKKVLVERIGKGQMRHEVALPELPEGLYFWELRNGEGRLDSGKVVVR